MTNQQHLVSGRRLMWFWHVERKDLKDWVEACRELEVMLVKAQGRPIKMLNDYVIEDMKKMASGGKMHKTKQSGETAYC